MDKFAIIFQPQNLQLYWTGFLATMELLAISLVAGGLLTLPLTLMRVSRNLRVSMPVWQFTDVVRGTPLQIQVYFIYYGNAHLERVQALGHSLALDAVKDPFFCAVAAFSLNTCAYTSRCWPAPSGKPPAVEAPRRPAAVVGRAYPCPACTPGYSNELVMMLHATSLASVVPALYDDQRRLRNLQDLLPGVPAVHLRRGPVFHADLRAGVRVPAAGKALPGLPAAAHQLIPFSPSGCDSSTTPDFSVAGHPAPITSLHFGQAANGRKAYIQSSLHADELPGMLTAHKLRGLLDAAEAAGDPVRWCWCRSTRSA
jgi:arginine/ornithine transport system permease protein